MDKTTPRIACLAWGSLIWNPGDLPAIGEWQPNGPMLPVEFARESVDHRMTLVICEDVEPVQTYWVLLNVPDLKTAIARLARREGITKRVNADIGYFDGTLSTSSGLSADVVKAWGTRHELDGAVWTNLPWGFKDSRGVMPSGTEVVAHLAKLDGKVRDQAREYIENAPGQIDTAYRRMITNELGWAN